MPGARSETAVFGQMKQAKNVVATNPSIEYAQDKDGT